MAEMLNFREAVQRAGVSRQRLNEAIKSGRLPAARGGGPGKPTTIQLEDLQAWCLSEGLAMPVAASERLERSPPPEFTGLLARLDQMFAGMERLERLVEHTLERLERSQAEAITQAVAHIAAELQAPKRVNTPTLDRAAVIARIRHARDQEKRRFDQIAGELNAAGIPTFSGRGTWSKANVRRFYQGM